MEGREERDFHTDRRRYKALLKKEQVQQVGVEMITEIVEMNKE